MFGGVMQEKNKSEEINQKDKSSNGIDESGLEKELESGPAEIEVPFDPTKIDIIVKPMSISSLQVRLKNHELDLTPDFQRQANVWNIKRKSRLIESILLRIPLPSFYFSEDDDGSYAVVDGLQRLCAIFHFMEREELERATNSKLNPLRLVGLQYLKELEDYPFSKLDRKFQRRISELEITANIIRASTPPAVKFNVFARLNQGGMPLNAQEIRNAIFPGEWRNYLRQMAEHKDFLRVTEHGIRTERQQDLEMVLRFVALWQLGRPYKRPDYQTLDEFLNNTVEKVLIHWNKIQWHEVVDRFLGAIEVAQKVFGRHVFRKSHGNYYRTPINRGLFESQLIVLSDLNASQRDKLILNKSECINRFASALEVDDDFRRALLYATGSSEACNTRLRVMQRIVKEAINA
jgi:hypothetical protein